MTKTVAITLISTFNSINPHERPKPNSLVKNTLEDMVLLMIACEDRLLTCEVIDAKSQKAAECHPQIKSYIEEITVGLDKVSEVQLKWLRKNKG